MGDERTIKKKKKRESTPETEMRPFDATTANSLDSSESKRRHHAYSHEKKKNKKRKLDPGDDDDLESLQAESSPGSLSKKPKRTTTTVDLIQKIDVTAADDRLPKRHRPPIKGGEIEETTTEDNVLRIELQLPENEREELCPDGTNEHKHPHVAVDSEEDDLGAHLLHQSIKWIEETKVFQPLTSVYYDNQDIRELLSAATKTDGVVVLDLSMHAFDGEDGNPLDFSVFYPWIPASRNLTTVLLRQTKLDRFPGRETLFEKIGEAPHVFHVDLSENQLTTKDAQSLSKVLLRKNKGLKHFDLSRNQIGDEGAEAIASSAFPHPALEALLLGCNGIENKGAISIAKGLLNPDGVLHELDLSGNNIGDKGFRAIAKGLKKNKQLRILNLSVNAVSGENEEAIWAPWRITLENNQVLESLDFSHNTLGGDCPAAVCIFQGLEKNSSLTTLSMCDTQIDHDDILALVAYFESSTGAPLVTLDLSLNQLPRDDTWKKLALALLSSRTLVSLNCAQCGITDNTASHLSEMLAQSPTALKYLDLSSNHVTGLGLKKLEESLRYNEILQTLDLEGNPVTTTDDATKIRNPCRTPTKVKMHNHNHKTQKNNHAKDCHDSG